MTERINPKDFPQLKLNVNRKEYIVAARPDTPLLWVIREEIGLTGTTYGCGVAVCGACTVHVDGEAVRSCSLLFRTYRGRRSPQSRGFLPMGVTRCRKRGLRTRVPQCGYCHSGQIMTAAALLAENPTPTDEDIDDAMSDNICRCGTYQRIRRAIHRASQMTAEGGKKK